MSSLVLIIILIQNCSAHFLHTLLNPLTAVDLLERFYSGKDVVEGEVVALPT